MDRTIIKCPYCSLQGATKNLAEILPDGSLKIMRMIKDDPYTNTTTIDFTIVKAEEYQLICGACQSVVVYKYKQPVIEMPQVNIMLAWGTMMQQYYAKM